MEMLLLYLCSAVIVATSALQISQAPANISVTTGSDVRLTCRVIGDTANDFMIWYEFITSSGGTRIYNSYTKAIEHPNSQKYAIQGTYDLVVQNVSLSDGGVYCCNLFSDQTFREADVLVFGTTSCHSTSVEEGQNMSVSCHVTYGGRVQPVIEMTTNDSTSLDGYQETGNNSVTYYSNFTASWTDDGKDVICNVSVKNPSYKDTCVTKMDVRYGVRNVSVNPLLKAYQVGDVITCAAFGNPSPDYVWMRLVPARYPTILGANLTITNEMLGVNLWRCMANNTVGSRNVSSSLDVSFGVVARRAGCACVLGDPVRTVLLLLLASLLVSS